MDKRKRSVISLDVPSIGSVNRRGSKTTPVHDDSMCDTTYNLSYLSGRSGDDPHSPTRENELKQSGSLFQAQRSKSEGKLYCPDMVPPSKLSKRESYKAQKKHYRSEKKRAAKELLSTLKDPAIIVMSDWLKVRGSLKGWTKLWCVLKPGLLLLYKSPKTHKTGYWVGTVLLNTCELIERPSKKDGFCFKLFHPMEQSIWASRGPKSENIGAITQPLPMAYLIFRAPSEVAGKTWMDALELSLRCSSLLMRSMTRDGKPASQSSATDQESFLEPKSFISDDKRGWDESDYERHFRDQGLEDDVYTDDNREGGHSNKSSDTESEHNDAVFEDDIQPMETLYSECTKEEFGLQGDAGQVEVVADENKSLIWTLVKQVRPGMDLSKVVLPTFILEPRSFLDKMSDYYFHADLLSKALLEDDPFNRMKAVVRWYLSGFYKKPKGLKKPYNPILGETFRCLWKHPDTNSRTFYVAEQVSHHPPVSAFYVTNRQDGFCISGTILAKSKFYGNSLSAILDGSARLTFLKLGEDYVVTMPFAHCKGILLGTLSMELGGKVAIDCDKTGYKTEIDFKLRPFLGGNETANAISGKIRLGKETIATLEGHWDGEIHFKDRRTGESELFWNPTIEIKEKRLKRYTVPLDQQGQFESERLWQHVTIAIHSCDQEGATKEKAILEDSQRREAKERKIKIEEWIPKLFEQNTLNGEWHYKHADSRPWDPRNDLVQFEKDCIIQTKTRHKTPLVRATSIMSVDDAGSGRGTKRQISKERLRVVRATRIRRSSMTHLRPLNGESGSSSPEPENQVTSSDSEGKQDVKKSYLYDKREHNMSITAEFFKKQLQPIVEFQQEIRDKLLILQSRLDLVVRQQAQTTYMISHRDYWLVFAVFTMQLVLHWLFKS